MYRNNLLQISPCIMHLKVWKLLHDSPNLAVLHLCHLLERGHVREAELVTSDQVGPHPPTTHCGTGLCGLPSPGCPAPGPRHEPAAAEVPTPAPVSYNAQLLRTSVVISPRPWPGSWVSETCPVSNSSASLAQQTSSGPAAVVAGGGRPSTTTTRVHSYTSGTDRGIVEWSLL